MTDEEISSILESDLTLEEKSSILASYWPKDNKFPTSSPIKLQVSFLLFIVNTHTHRDTELGSMGEMTAEEISSILDSDLTLKEKSSILASYWPKDNKFPTSSPIKLQERESNLIKKENKTRCAPSAVKLKAKEKVPLDLKSTSDKKQSSISSGVKLKGTVQRVETKPKEDNHDKLRISKGTDESFSQAKVEKPLGLKSTSDKKQASISSGVKLKEKIEDTKPNPKKVKDDDRKSESESNIVKESNHNANPNAEKKGMVDPLTAEEVSSIFDSKLTSEEKSSLLRESDLIKKETKMRSTPSTVKFKLLWPPVTSMLTSQEDILKDTQYAFLSWSLISRQCLSIYQNRNLSTYLIYSFQVGHRGLKVLQKKNHVDEA
ncbi:hypothetical protein CDL12_01863 [Handroanthus impetiginosus]|uniref:Uncharacterized protein n=1 Tax=Handroanthus impetiginosus TaxID=429701 RepID=A0A2G9I6K6_9LAMI|nr:hypothetical protein CDL12_01863 [Handroanthus impetiginosus]